MGDLGQANFIIPPNEVDWTGITHVVHFGNGNVSTTPPYFSPVTSANDSIEWSFNGIANPGCGPTCWRNWQDTLIRTAHRRGTKVVITIQAVDPRNLNPVAEDSTRTDLFAQAVIAYCQRKGYDGIELDWEGWLAPITTSDNVNRLVRRLRVALNTMTPRGEFLMSPGGSQAALYYPSQDSLVDQFNFQMYDFAYAWYPTINSNAVWYISPLHRGTVPPTFQGEAYDTRGPEQWMTAGHDRPRLGILMPAYGWVMKNADSLFQPMLSGGDYGYAKYQDSQRLLTNGGSEGWDDERKVPYIRGTAIRTEGNMGWGQPGVQAGQRFFATFDNFRSIREKVVWAESVGIGGIGLYDLTMDLDPSLPFGQRNPLLNAALAALGNRPGPGGNPIPDFALEQNFPNPFNPKTTIQYTVTADAFVTVKVYDLLGRHITTLFSGQRAAGTYTIDFSSSSLADGVYIVSLQVGGSVKSKKMVLIK